MEDTVFQSSPGELSEEPLDGVQPGTGCRNEVEGPAWVPRQPGPNFGLFVCGVVVQDDVNRLVLGQLSFNRVEEADELLMPVTLHVAADDGAVENIQGREKCRGAVALVIMGHRAGTTLLHGKTRLRPIQRLDLTFLIDGKDNRMGRRRDVETDHIVKLLGESLVVR
ncbi:hypothetical protein FQZ97_976560 [compost metagenome]